MTARPKTFSLTLTEAQYIALAGAVAYADLEDEANEPLDPEKAGERAARTNAWAKIKGGYYGDRIR